MLWYGLTFATIRKSVELKGLCEIKPKGFREMTACWSMWSLCRPMDRLWMFTSTSVKVHHCRASPSSASVKPCTCCHWRQTFSTESRSSALFFCYIIIIISQFSFIRILWLCLVRYCIFNSYCHTCMKHRMYHIANRVAWLLTNYTDEWVNVWIQWIDQAAT